MLGSPPAPSKPWAQRKNRGRVVQAVNLELNDFTPPSREDREKLPIQFELDAWSGHFRYMFQPEDLVNRCSVLSARRRRRAEPRLSEGRTRGRSARKHSLGTVRRGDPGRSASTQRAVRCRGDLRRLDLDVQCDVEGPYH
jgi:hypothetical protein